VLHHFGSREGLVKAVVERAIRSLQEDLARAVSSDANADARTARQGGERLYEKVSEVLLDKGHARVMAWLLLSGHGALANDEVRAGWTQIAEATHAARVARWKGKTRPSYEDTRFTIVLSALALFGAAIAGETTFDMAGFGRSAAVQRKFRRWLATTLAGHMSRG
jgi:AcrR family transcriptional regulator